MLISLFHYTDKAGLEGILKTRLLHPSLVALNPADARYGDGQYFSDIVPGEASLSVLSRLFLGFPFQGRRFTHYVEVDLTELDVIFGRVGVFVVLNNDPLDLTNRILSSGPVPLP